MLGLRALWVYVGCGQVYEKAVVSAVVLSDWALFLSHVCGLLNEQYVYTTTRPANIAGIFRSTPNSLYSIADCWVKSTD